MNPTNSYSLNAGNSVCPATEQDLKDFLRLDDNSCGQLDIYLETAKQAVISYLGMALMNQEYTIVFNGFPYQGTVTGGLSRDTAFYEYWIDLPYAKLVEVTEVATIDQDGVETIIDAENYVVDAYSTPARIKFNGVVNRCARLKIVYTAGFGTDTEDVPLAIRLGILQVAGYLYEHRGECSPETAIAKAGAGMALNPYRVISKL